MYWRVCIIRKKKSEVKALGRGLKSVPNESRIYVITFRISLDYMPNLRHFMIDWEINEKIFKRIIGTDCK